MKEVVVHSDGACSGNPGPGGWAAILRYEEVEKEISGGAPATTNNRMELQAAIEALRALREPCIVTFYTDSKYLMSGITRWVELWVNREWLTKGDQPVKNQELWKELYELTSRHSIVWHWTKGHVKNSGNSRCDRLARMQIAEINRSHKTAELEESLQRFQREHWAVSDRHPLSS
jgi:ribonuclease HI